MGSGDHFRLLVIVTPEGRPLEWTLAQTQPGCWRRFACSSRPKDYQLFRRIALAADIHHRQHHNFLFGDTRLDHQQYTKQ